MRIICVDDEELILSLTVAMCRELPRDLNVTQVEGFDSADKALAYVQSNDVDIAILDINMPDFDGLLLAGKIKELQPAVAIIFLTGYSEYAVDAYALHASGYIMKPISKDRLAQEVKYAISAQASLDKAVPHIQVRTFGKFDILVDGKPISFARSKSKELLAYLVDKQGLSVTRADAFSALWEEGIYDRSKQKQLDVIIRSLRDTLRQNGISEILEMQSGTLGVIPDKMNCDLYRYLEGDMEAVRAYRGEYMSDYSWAVFTEAYMNRYSDGRNE